MKALFAHELSGEELSSVWRHIVLPELSDDPSQEAFADTLLATTAERRSEIDRVLAKHVNNWDLDRIAPIDRVLLRMATCELLALEDVPPKVSIDEAIEIAKQYSTPSSGRFINGVLDAVLEDLKAQGRVHKTGRGLVGFEA